MIKIIKFVLFIPLLSIAQEKSETKSEYPNYVGDIELLKMAFPLADRVVLFCLLTSEYFLCSNSQ